MTEHTETSRITVIVLALAALLLLLRHVARADVVVAPEPTTSGIAQSNPAAPHSSARYPGERGGGV